MSNLGVGVTLYPSGCHEDHIIYHFGAICYIPSHECSASDVHCCLDNSLRVQFIVPPLTEDPATVLIRCELGFLGTYAFGFQSSLSKCIWYMFTSIQNLTWIELNKYQWSSHGYVIRENMLVTIMAWCGLTRLGSIFCKNKKFFNHLDSSDKTTKWSQYSHWCNKYKNACNNWQSWSVVSKCMTTYISRQKCRFWR